MGEREIREKYGGKLPKAINRAIRAECTGGNEALDMLTNLAGAAKQSHWKDKKGLPTPEAEAYYKHMANVVEKMGAQIRRKWGLPVFTNDDKPKRTSRSAPPRKSGPASTKRTGAGPAKRAGAGPTRPRTAASKAARPDAKKRPPKA